MKNDFVIHIYHTSCKMTCYLASEAILYSHLSSHLWTATITSLVINFLFRSTGYLL